MTDGTGQFVTDLEACGVVFSPEGVALRFRAPVGMLSDELRTELQKRKLEIVAWLWERTPPAFTDPMFWLKVAAIATRHAPHTDRHRLRVIYHKSETHHASMGLDPDVCQQMAFNEVAEGLHQVTGLTVAIQFRSDAPCSIELIARAPVARAAKFRPQAAATDIQSEDDAAANVTGELLWGVGG